MTLGEITLPFYLLSQWVPAFKGNNLLQEDEQIFHFKSRRKGSVLHGNKQKVTKVVPLVKLNGGNNGCCCCIVVLRPR